MVLVPARSVSFSVRVDQVSQSPVPGSRVCPTFSPLTATLIALVPLNGLGPLE